MKYSFLFKITLFFWVSVVFISCGNIKPNENKINPKIQEETIEPIYPLKTDKIFQESIELKSQKEIDVFFSKGYSFIDGSLSILYSENIENLDKLSSLRAVNGEFIISGCKNLKSVKGLRNLEVVNGDFAISGTKNLKKINFLDNLNTINGLLIFGTDYNLIEISSFNKLKNCKGIYINYCPDLELLNGFVNITTLKKLSISSAKKLKMISNFINLKTINQTLAIEHNTLLSNINFPKLTSVKEYFAIHENYTLSGDSLFINNISSLNKLYIWGNTNFSNYCSITDLITEKKIDSIDFSENKFNPTYKELKEGKCKK